jgi:TatD DNase family protein
VLIDTHCHIDQFSDPANLAKKCESDKVITVAVTNFPTHYELALPHVGGMRYIKLALGFHPLLVRRHQHALGRFFDLLPKAQFVGEIGLDFSRDGLPSRSEQTAVFNSIISALSESTKFVTIHSREAAESVLDVLEQHNFHNAVLHWFTGTQTSLKRAIKWGCLFSVNPAMIRSQKGKLIISSLPKDRVLTETDGPYVKIGNQPAEPSDVKYVISFLSEAWKISEEEVISQIYANFTRVIGQPNS